MSKPYSSAGAKGSAIRAILLANPEADRAEVARLVGCTVSRVAEVVGAMREAGELADPRTIRLRWLDRVGDEVETPGHGVIVVTEALAILAERLEGAVRALVEAGAQISYGRLARAVRSPWGPNQSQFGRALDLVYLGAVEDGWETDPTEVVVRAGEVTPV